MLSKSISDALNKTTLLWSRTLQPEEFEAWEEALKGVDSGAAIWAFSESRKTARFFPKPKDILDLVCTYKARNMKKFQSCGACEEGWLRIFEGRTAGGNSVDQKLGAVVRCSCFVDWARA